MEKYSVEINGEDIIFEEYWWHDGPLLEINKNMAIVWYNNLKDYQICFLIYADTKLLINKEVDFRDFITKNKTMVCKRYYDYKLVDLELIEDFSNYELPENGIFI